MKMFIRNLWIDEPVIVIVVSCFLVSYVSGILGLGLLLPMLVLFTLCYCFLSKQYSIRIILISCAFLIPHLFRNSLGISKWLETDLYFLAWAGTVLLVIFDVYRKQEAKRNKSSDAQ